MPGHSDGVRPHLNWGLLAELQQRHHPGKHADAGGPQVTESADDSLLGIGAMLLVGAGEEGGVEIDQQRAAAQSGSEECWSVHGGSIAPGLCAR